MGGRLRRLAHLRDSIRLRYPKGGVIVGSDSSGIGNDFYFIDEGAVPPLVPSQRTTVCLSVDASCDR